MTEGLRRRHMHRVSRRTLLRSAFVGGSGLLAAYVVGCDGGGTDELAGTPTTAGPTSTPAPVVRWQQHSPAGLMPPPRRDHSLVTDGRRLYLFGGRGPEPLADFWAYDIAQGKWAELALAGPSARFGHSAVWDATGSRMVVFGGQSGSFLLNDIWQFDPAANEWAELPEGEDVPAARYGAGAASDPEGRLLVTQGLSTKGRLNDTWSYDPAGAAWADEVSSGGRPPERSATRAVWDSVRDRLIMYGGQATDNAFLDDLWTLDGDGWSQLARAPAPKGRNSHSMVYDGQNARVIIFGGETAEGLQNDIWVFDAPDEFWKSAFGEGDPPVPRLGHDAVWVPEPQAMFVFGGNDGEADLNDLWELSTPA